jgi:signal peptidase I
MDVASQNLTLIKTKNGIKPTNAPGSPKRLCNPIYLWVAGLVLLCLGICPVRFGRTVGESMIPTLKPNQMFVMYRCFGSNYIPMRNDVIVFRHDGEVLIKRVWATPGDCVWIAHSSAGNSLIPKENLANWKTMLAHHPNLGEVQKLKIGPNEIFVMGDNYSDSTDSRDFGPVKIEAVMGRVRVPENNNSIAVSVAYASNNKPINLSY